MYINPNIVTMKINDVNFLFNFNNGVVSGIDERGFKLFKELSSEDIEQSVITEEEREFLSFLVENDFISEKSFVQKTKVISAYVHLTNKCNLHCVGCYSLDDKRNRDKDLSTEEIKDAILKLYQAGVENLIFSGGEPLLRQDIVDIVKYAKEIIKIPTVILITNGTIFDKSKLAALANYVDTVSVSVDGYSAECPSFLRDKGIFNRIVRTVEYLKNSGNNVNLIPTVHHLNSDKLMAYVELSESLGVTLSFSILSACFEGEISEYLPDATDIQYISNFMLDTNVTMDDSTIQGGEFLIAEKSCGAGTSMVSIGTEGNVYPCHMLMYDEFCIGNIKEGGLSELREKSDRAKQFENLSVDSVEGCFSCQFRGGCRGRSYLKTQNVTSRDPYCNLFYNYYKKTTDAIFNH